MPMHSTCRDVLLALLCFPGAASGQQAVSLALGGHPGDWAEYGHEKTLALELPAELGGSVRTRTALRIRMTVEQADSDAIAYRSRVDDLVFEVDPAPPELPDLSGLQGMEFLHRSDRSGRLLAVEIPGVDAAAVSAIRPQLENWLTQLGFPPLPPDPVDEGVVWTDSTRLSAVEVLGFVAPWDLIEIRHATLERVVTTPDGPVAVLRVRSSWRLDHLAESPVGAVRGGGRGEQTIRFDLGRGRYLGSTGDSQLRFPVAAGRNGGSVLATAAARHRTELLEASRESISRPD